MGPSEMWTSWRAGYLQVGRNQRNAHSSRPHQNSDHTVSRVSAYSTQVRSTDNQKSVRQREVAWSDLAIDYIGPMPISRGCQYACTVVDTYSGYLIAFPCKRATQLNTLKTLNLLMLYYGKPLQVQSDNASHFKGKLVQDFCVQENIEWIFHVPYYPPGGRFDGAHEWPFKGAAEEII